jgi:asparagine synthase (glutamine-hydrolysing)
MCGLIFADQQYGKRISIKHFEAALNRQKWRGPDAQHVLSLKEGRFLLGHNRLSIIDPKMRSDQPMISSSGRYAILYNGEIYNHNEIRVRLNINFKTTSDTETILEGYEKIGEQIFDLLDGMFALVIVDIQTGRWLAARDPFGIKPLFIGKDTNGTTVIGSEAPVVASLVKTSYCTESIEEWKLIRRPVPGKSFFQGVEEVLPGRLVRSDNSTRKFWELVPSNLPYEQEAFEKLMRDTIAQHEISDVENVSLLSGGLDSAVITALSSVSRAYCVGLQCNNEFDGASETASLLNRELITVAICPEDLRNNWRELTKIRGEPLGLPNEGLIYEVCRKMQPMEKVVLTGEGADELLFGYDGIYRWAVNTPWQGVEKFLRKYGYSTFVQPTERLISYIEELKEKKDHIEFLEDFFYYVHLPGLLRRMDFASMAASKEARVPFVNKRLISYMYRRPSGIKINGTHSKLPLRELASKQGLQGVLSRKKIGFSAQIESGKTRFDEYKEFQSIVLETLKW